MHSKIAETIWGSGKGARERGMYPSFSTGSLIGNGNESSVIEQTLIGTAFRLLFLLLFLDFWGLRFDLAGTRKRAVLLALQGGLEHW